MQPRKPLTKEQALAIAADALREVGLEHHAFMIEVPERLELALVLAKDEHVERDYDDVWCRACHSSSRAELHEPDCFVLHTYKFLGDPRFELHERTVKEIADAEARRKAERDEHERLIALHGRCEFKNSAGTRCTNHGQHTGDHRCPVGIAGMSDMLKRLYSPERIENIAYDQNPLMNMFGVDRSADPVRLTGIVTETPVGHFDETGAWHPNHNTLPSDDPASKIITDLKKVPSVIVSPFIKAGDAPV